MNKSGRKFHLGPFSLVKNVELCTNQKLERQNNTTYHYCMVNNIPVSFHASDLRNFFAEFTEANKFKLFHFRHRPQVIKLYENEMENSSTQTKLNNESDDSNPGNNNAKEAKNVKKLCCPVRFTDESFNLQFVKKYNGKFWIDKKGNDLPSRCVVSNVQLSPQDLANFTTKEFSPPSFMLKGNIGCTNSHFLQLIKDCRLPPSLIRKLGLEFPRGRRYKKYSKVPLDYGTVIEDHVSDVDEEEGVLTARGHSISANRQIKRVCKKGSDEESNADEDEDRCEEWERHQALHDEVTSHGGVFSQTKERLYEEKIELKWEKGGSGLVFYTDAQYWDAEKGGFDERTADDWDVDMEGYYVSGGGDKDAKDLLEMRQSERFQQGLEDISVFSRPENRSRHRRAKSPSPTPSISGKIGDFEKYTKGIGRKLMEKQGWSDGSGIGKSKIGMVDALENDGKGPRDRSGLGYYGEKLILSSSKKRPKKFHDYSLDSNNRVIIGTIFDKPNELDREEPLLRRNAPTFIKRYDQPTSASKLVPRVPKQIKY